MAGVQVQWAEREPARPPIRLPRSKAVSITLGEANYRRSEESWEEAGRPRARVTVSARGDELVVDVSVLASEVVFVPASATNPYDNEHPDVNGHGVQLYVRTADDGGAWIVVPEEGRPSARIRPLAGWGALAMRGATWVRTGDGFSMQLRVALPSLAKAANAECGSPVDGRGRERDGRGP